MYDIGLIIGVVQSLFDRLLRKKLYCLWLYDRGRWKNLNPYGNSLRRCHEALRVILGKNPGNSVQYLILPKNFSPPERGSWDED